MKKHFTILLGLLVIFSSLFTSCNEEELDPNICKITVKSEGNGKVSITDYIGTSVNVLIGNRVEVVATPDEGWAFIGWYISGTESPVSTDAAFTFITSENVTLTARFAKLSDIIIRSSGNGRVAFKDATGNSIPVIPGTVVTVIATPDTDCDFVGWFVGDSETPISTEETYTFTVTENIILTGQFSKRPIVTVRSAGNGSVSIKDTYYTSKAFLPGTEVTIIATPYKDCDFIGWFVADAESPISTDLEYTFNMTEDITLTAKFSKRPVVTIINAGNGNVSFKDYPGTSIAVLPDTEITVIATPNENCDFVGWYIGDSETPVSTKEEYTFTVTENIILTGQFSKRPVVTIRKIGNGSAFFKDYTGTSVAVMPNTEVTVIASPNEDYDFIGWFVNDNLVSIEQTFVYNANNDVVLIAKFTSDNIIENGGFEDWYGSNPTAWGEGNIGHKSTISQSTEAYDGNYAAVVNGSTQNMRLASQSYTLPAGTYTLSAYIKQSGSAAGAFKLGYGIIKDGAIANSDYKYLNDTTTATSDWQLHTVKFTLTEETIITALIMNSKIGNGAAILVDDVSIICETEW